MTRQPRSTMHIKEVDHSQSQCDFAVACIVPLPCQSRNQPIRRSSSIPPNFDEPSVTHSETMPARIPINYTHGHRPEDGQFSSKQENSNR